MSLPEDSDLAADAPQPAQESSPAAPMGGQRSLAAIVFTDTVGFSRRMAMDEVGTLALVQRDLHLMEVTCQAFEGHMLKSTGDGLLLVFSSAVQAVACSLEIQRSIHQQNLELPESDGLQHRIGIHLGDVLITETDVFGDGVNVAARLQREAVPGGICLSKTVYDVVQNRLPFYTNSIETRKLKNIGAVKAYQISPVKGGFTSPGGIPITLGRRLKPYLPRLGSVAVALLLLVVLALGGEVWHLLYLQKFVRAHRKAAAAAVATTSKPLDPINTTPVVEIKPEVPPSPTQSANTLPLPVIPPADLNSPLAPINPVNLAPTVSPDLSSFQTARTTYMRHFDFEGMRRWIHEHPNLNDNELGLERACIGFQHLFTWWKTQFAAYSAQKPLSMENKRTLERYQLYPEPGGRVAILNEDEDKREVPASSLQAPILARIISELMKTHLDPEDPEADQLRQEFTRFVQYYRVTAQTSAPPASGPAPSSPGLVTPLPLPSTASP